jgi:ribosomal protein S18 acetylase RimI-like enzyme
MSAMIKHLSNKASETEIAEHLSRCDAGFVPPLSGRVNINDYAKKIAGKAERFEIWSHDTLVALVAAYCNDLEKGIVYVTSVSVLKEWMGKGLAAQLMHRCIEYAKLSGMRQVSLEVASINLPAIRLYEKIGFVPDKLNSQFVSMNLYLKSGKDHEQNA